MADKKLNYQMVSPGEAWNNFVNSKDGHNAASVTPSYLDNTKDKQAGKDIAAPTPDAAQKGDAPNLFSGHQKNESSLTMDKTKMPEKGIEIER